MNSVNSHTLGRKVYVCFNSLAVLIICIITLIPIIHVLMASFSDPVLLYRNLGVLVKPLGFSLEGYKETSQMKEIWIGYRNTIFYTVCYTALATVLTLLGGYVLSRKGLFWGRPIMLIITFTMIFNGGMVPTYLLVSKLNWLDSPLAVIVPNCVSVFNLIIMRTFFEGVPASLEESAKLDGAGNLRILFSIMIPISMAGVSVIALFYMIYQWNAYFDAMIYLRETDLAPLQNVIRQIIMFSSSAAGVTSGESGNYGQMLQGVVKNCIIMISIVPMLIVYPFIQKYFAGGVMIGAVKE